MGRSQAKRYDRTSPSRWPDPEVPDRRRTPPRSALLPRVLSALGLLAVLGVGTAAPATAQRLSEEVEWGGMFRARFESRGVDNGPSPAFTGMRTRVQGLFPLSGEVRVFAQLQDVRRWGEETSTVDGSAEGLDMHQAFLEAGQRGESALWTRVGRQEIEFSDGRFLGIAPWNNFGRTFDGARLAARAGSATVLDALVVQLRESSTDPSVSEAVLMGLWSRTEFGTDRVLEAFVLHDTDDGPAPTGRTTVGSELRGSSGPVSWRVQGAWQTGEFQGLDLSAWMAAGTIRVPVADDRGSVALWYDHYSGDADPGPGSTAGFDDLFNRNHLFLGFADLFTGSAADTGGRGLRDAAVKLGWSLPLGTRVGLDLHRFLVADDTGLAEAALLDEVDLTLTVPVLEGTNVILGGSWADLTDTGVALGVSPGDVLFGYAWLEATF